MKTRTVRIFLTREEADRAIGRLIRQAFKGGLREPVLNEVFVSLDELARALTPRRAELLAKIQEFKPESIKELADRIGRDFKNVYNDLQVLASIGLVDLEKEGRATKVSVPDEIVFKWEDEKITPVELAKSFVKATA